MKKVLENKVRAFAQNYLNNCDFEKKEVEVDMISGNISDNYSLFDFSEEEIDFIEKEKLLDFIARIIEEETNSFMNDKFYYDDSCLTGAYVGLDHIVCDNENYYEYDELQANCDDDKIYLFQLHNNSSLPPLVLFAVFEEESEEEAINCQNENDCVFYHAGFFDDALLNSYL